jgi:gluconate 2-dehydrogenase gamma chain
MQAQAAAPPAREAYETLTAAESDVLEAVTARLIPADVNGPGAKEARAAHYIDRALAGPLSGFRANYTAGLASLDAYARSKKGSPFAQLAVADQDALLAELQNGTATGFAQPPTIFFNLMRTHTIEGTFGDPYYGGNANFVGWDLIGYPGVRTSVAAGEQQMNTKVAPNHRSAYDFAMFRKGGADGR